MMHIYVDHEEILSYTMMFKIFAFPATFLYPLWPYIFESNFYQFYHIVEEE